MPAASYAQYMLIKPHGRQQGSKGKARGADAGSMLLSAGDDESRAVATKMLREKVTNAARRVAGPTAGGWRGRALP